MERFESEKGRNKSSDLANVACVSRCNLWKMVASPSSLACKSLDFAVGVVEDEASKLAEAEQSALSTAGASPPPPTAATTTKANPSKGACNTSQLDM